MSRSQFHCIKMFILRHAWLNLWDKHMTTGRINQVAEDEHARSCTHWHNRGAHQTRLAQPKLESISRAWRVGNYSVSRSTFNNKKRSASKVRKAVSTDGLLTKLHQHRSRGLASCVSQDLQHTSKVSSTTLQIGTKNHIVTHYVSIQQTSQLPERILNESSQ